VAVFICKRKELFGKSINVNGRPYVVRDGKIDVVVADDIQKLRRLRADWDEAGSVPAPATPVVTPAAPAAPASPPQTRTYDDLIRWFWGDAHVCEQVLKMPKDQLAEALTKRGFPLPTGDDWQEAVVASLSDKKVGEVPAHIWNVFMTRVNPDLLTEHAGESALDLLSGELENRVKAFRRQQVAPATSVPAAPPPPALTPAEPTPPPPPPAAPEEEPAKASKRSGPKKKGEGKKSKKT
jgi:hypothetical protein